MRPGTALPKTIDLSHRVEPEDLPEWMDEPCSYDDYRACLLDLEKVNRLTLAYRPTLRWLDALVAGGPKTPLRVVDVGCGGGDMLRRIERWAGQRGVAVHLVGIDLNPYAARLARELAQDGSSIEWITGDAFGHQGRVDVVLSSLFTHHLGHNEIVGFLAWMESVAERGWFVNDLCRERVPYTLFGWLARAMRWHRFVQHDGPVSFRRSLREEDWLQAIAAAGIAKDQVTLTRWTPGRLCLGRSK